MAVDVDHMTPDEEVEITSDDLESLNRISQAANKFLTVSTCGPTQII